MNIMLKKIAAAALSAVVMVCSLNAYTFSGGAANEEKTVYTLSYNIEGLNIEDTSLFEPVQLEAGSYAQIPDVDIENDVTYASGWTSDGIYLYEPNDYYKMPEHDVELQIVWVDSSSDTFKVTYKTDGEECDFDEKGPVNIATIPYYPGECVVPSMVSLINKGDFLQSGWKFNGHVFNSTQKMIMPAEDVLFEPNWLGLFDVSYTAGDVDRINGTKTFTHKKTEGLEFDLSLSDRISRSGFNLVGWLCDYDNQIYKPGAYFNMVSQPVVFTAVWEPKSYVVVFNQNNGKAENIKISGKTDETIIAPEPTSTKEGYKFAGWQFEDVVYKPGEEFVIPGALPGLGIALKGVWVEDTGEEDTDYYSSFTLVEARKQYVNGEISADELREIADFLLRRN